MFIIFSAVWWAETVVSEDLTWSFHVNKNYVYEVLGCPVVISFPVEVAMEEKKLDGHSHPSRRRGRPQGIRKKRTRGTSCGRRSCILGTGNLACRIP